MNKEDDLNSTEQAAAALWDAIYLLVDVRQDLAHAPGLPVVFGFELAAWEERLVRAEGAFGQVLDTLEAARRHGAVLDVHMDERATSIVPNDLPYLLRGWALYRSTRMTVPAAEVEAIRLEDACRMALRGLGESGATASWYTESSESRSARIDRRGSRRRQSVGKVYAAG